MDIDRENVEDIIETLTDYPNDEGEYGEDIEKKMDRLSTKLKIAHAKFAGFLEDNQNIYKDLLKRKYPPDDTDVVRLENVINNAKERLHEIEKVIAIKLGQEIETLRQEISRQNNVIHQLEQQTTPEMQKQWELKGWDDAMQVTKSTLFDMKEQYEKPKALGLIKPKPLVIIFERMSDGRVIPMNFNEESKEK